MLDSGQGLVRFFHTPSLSEPFSQQRRPLHFELSGATLPTRHGLFLIKALLPASFLWDSLPTLFLTDYQHQYLRFFPPSQGNNNIRAGHLTLIPKRYSKRGRDRVFPFFPYGARLFCPFPLLFDPLQLSDACNTFPVSTLNPLLAH